MNAFPRRKRSLAAALIAAAAIVPLASSTTADAAVTTTKWNRAQFLQHALGFAANSTPAIDSVTYDRFQHLLRQTGNFAILIGDPKTDATFAAGARTVEAAAKAEGISKVYWFNPNLTGGATVGTTAWPNFDIRNSASITSLTAASRNKYNDAWGNIVAQSLGNGVVATRTNPGAAGQAVTTAAGTNVNDAGAPVFDYTGGWPTVPANSQDSYFLVYNTDNKVGDANDKIVASVNLTDDADVGTKVAAAIDNKTFATVEQFSWWREEANERSRAASLTTPTRGPNVEVLTEADRAGWNVNQITLPELVDLLQNATDADAAVLLGGTWCPNTRAVLPFVNKEAKAQNVPVYNYDTVLDGGKVAGNPTGGANPLQTRNAHNNGAFPSFLYAELVKQFLSNFQTEYQVGEGNAITFFPGGDTTKTADKVARLQVPYLFGYKGKGGTQPFGGTTRHWIHKVSATANKEYMSNWWNTNPQPNQLGLSGLPQEAPYWTTLNQRIAGYTWKTEPATVLADRTISTDATQFILDGDTATVTATQTGLSVTSGGPLAAGPAAIAPALAALGANAPTSFDDLKAKHLAERAKPLPDQTYLGQLNALAAPWGLADTRKSSVNTAWGNASTPSSVIGGATAKRALEVFFGGLPGGSLYTARTVAANEVTEGTAPTVSVTVSNPAGRTPAGNLSVDVKSAGASVHTGTAAVTGGAASFTLPATLAPGTYEYTVSYAGDEFIDAWSETRSLTVKAKDVVVNPTPEPTPDPTVVPIVTPAPTATPTPIPVAVKAKASKVAGAVSKAPTSKKSGKYKVTITTAKSAAKATGKVTLTLKKGKTTKKVTGTLKNGVVTVRVPKLAKGTWKVTVAWAGDTTYQAASASGASIKVTK